MKTEDAHSTSIKILRQVAGTREHELLAAVPLLSWEMEDTAREFGPGSYLIRPSGGEFRNKSFTIPVAEEFARRAGWGKVETVAPSAALAQRAAATAADRMGADGLGLVLEAVMKPIVERLDAMERRTAGGFDFEKFLALQMSMEDRAEKNLVRTMDMVARIQGGKPITGGNEDEEKGDALSSIAKGFGAGLGQALTNLLTPKPQPPIALPQAPPATPPAEPVRIPEGWTREELAECADAIAGMRQAAPRMKAAKLVTGAEGMADAILEMIQDDAVSQTLKLCEVIKRNPAALGVIDPEFSRDPYWLDVATRIHAGLWAEQNEP